MKTICSLRQCRWRAAWTPLMQQTLANFTQQINLHTQSQHVHNVFGTFLQPICNMFTTHLQLLAMSLQCLCNVFATGLQHICNMFTMSLWHICDTFALLSMSQMLWIAIESVAHFGKSALYNMGVPGKTCILSGLAAHSVDCHNVFCWLSWHVLLIVMWQCFCPFLLCFGPLQPLPLSPPCSV